MCFGARDETYGAFYILEHGLIHTFKLVHRHGTLSCTPNDTPSYWGCTNPRYGESQLLTVITYSNKTALPVAEYLGDTGIPCRYYSYHLNGVHANSPELTFKKLPSPMPVKVGQEFHIWYGQDLVDCSESNNAGQTCVDVFAWYDWTSYV